MVACDTFCSIANVKLKSALYCIDNDSYLESVDKSAESILACLKQVLVVSDFDDYVLLKSMAYDDLKYYVLRAKVDGLDITYLNNFDVVIYAKKWNTFSKKDAEDAYNKALALYNLVNNM